MSDDTAPITQLWEAIHLLGDVSPDDRIAFLSEMLVDGSGGTRSAAAAALSSLGQTTMLAERLGVETNKFVLATIRAHFGFLTRPTIGDVT